MSSRSTVLIVDDHPVYRRGLKALLSDCFDVVSEAREGGEAVEKALKYKPDVVIMDIRMPGMDGIEAARQIRAQLPHTGIVMISATDNEQQIFEAISAGVSGYIVKDDSPETMVQAIQHAAQGKAFLPPTIAKRVLAGVANSLNDVGTANNTDNTLSARELEILRLISTGLRNREIGNQLCISERTVGNHITNIYAKLHICDRAQAVVHAVKKGLIRV